MVAQTQISTKSHDYIFHPFQFIQNMKTEMKQILEDSSIIKLVHDVANDFKNLQRDFGIMMTGIINTQELFDKLYHIWQIKFEKMIEKLYNYPNVNHDGLVTHSDW
jgi:ribonuclease D